jgi:hypothetical protein
MMSRLRHPIRSLREPFGKAGLTVAILALVLAVVGGAWAAAGLSGKQKKEVTKIAKKYAGTNGTNGAPGTNGTNGAPGAKGDKGDKGDPGESVTASHLDPGEGGCAAGGTELSSASGTEVLCNGDEGSPWTAGGTLPAGQTLKGVWNTEASPGTESFKRFAASVSFLLPLQDAPAAHYININNKENYYDGTAGELKEREVPECTGNVEEPEAAPGNLCVYASREEGVLHEIPAFHKPLPSICGPGTENPDAEEYEVGFFCLASPRTSDRFGFTILNLSSGSGFAGNLEAGGTWAVTAAE